MISERPSGLILRLAVILMGFSAIWLQIFLIRELLVTFSGNELVIGIFLANWLLITAIGSFLSSRFASRTENPYFAFTILQFLLSFFFPLVVFLIRTIKYQLGINPGEGVTLPVLFLVSFVLTFPIALLVGFQFGYACRLMHAINIHSEYAVSRAYLFESLGSMAGGLLVGQIFIIKFDSFGGAVIVVLLNISFALLLLSGLSGVKVWRLSLLLLLIGSIFSIFIGLPHSLNRISREYQWHDYRVVAEGNSVYGHAIFLAYNEQMFLVSNGVPVATLPSSDIAHTEDLIDIPLLCHPEPKMVLMIGGGLGGPLDELVKHPVEHIDFVDLDPLLIELMQQYVPDSLLFSFYDTRIQSHFTDGRYFLQQSELFYDIILLNLPEPSSLEINRFYTREFFSLCRTRMHPDGILAFTLPGSISSMGRALCQLNNTIDSAARGVFPHIIILPDAYNLFIYSGSPLPDLSEIDKIESRRLARGLNTQLISPPYLEIKSDSLHNFSFREQIDNCPVSAINQDFKPVAVFYSLLYWNGIYAPSLTALLNWFEKTGIGPLILFLLVIFCALLFFTRKPGQRERIALLGAIAGTGFVGMGVTVILVLLFQTTFGYIYHWIGFLLAAFMAGLAAGSWQTDFWGKEMVVMRKFTILEFLFVGYLGVMFMVTQSTLAGYSTFVVKLSLYWIFRYLWFSGRDRICHCCRTYKAR